MFLPLHFCRLCLPPTGGDKPWHPGDFALYSLCFRGFHKWTRSPIPRLQTCERLTHLFREVLEKHDKSVTRSLCNQHNHPGQKKKKSRTATKKRVFFLLVFKQALSELIWTIFYALRLNKILPWEEQLNLYMRKRNSEEWQISSNSKLSSMCLNMCYMKWVTFLGYWWRLIFFFFHGGNENVCQWFDNPRENTPMCVLQDC